ncbi:hypothetical protein ABH912_002864 [Pseudomonas sp. BT76 TE3572]
MLKNPVNRIDRQVAFGKPNEIPRAPKSPCGSGGATIPQGMFSVWQHAKSP